MTVTALVSAKSAGVTTTALALTLASPRASLLAECDPAGGTVRAGYLRGAVPADHGLYHLAAAQRLGPTHFVNAFASHLRPMDKEGHRKLLPGLTDPAQAAALGRTWPALAEALRILSADGGYDVFVDAGRLVVEAGRLHPTLTPAPLLHRADRVLVVVRTDQPSLALARHVVEPLRAELDERGTGAEALALLLIESGPYRLRQIGEAFRAPVAACLPWDPETAGFLASGGRPPRGPSPLLQYARRALEQFEAADRSRCGPPPQQPESFDAGAAATFLRRLTDAVPKASANPRGTRD